MFLLLFQLGTSLSPHHSSINHKTSQDIPGPGAYGSPGPSLGDGGPAFTLLGRVVPPKKTNEEGPAPGDYSSPGASGGPAFTLGGKRRESATREAQRALEPGPGQYTNTSPGPDGPAFTLGKRWRKPRRSKAMEVMEGGEWDLED